MSLYINEEWYLCDIRYELKEWNKTMSSPEPFEWCTSQREIKYRIKLDGLFEEVEEVT